MDVTTVLIIVVFFSIVALMIFDKLNAILALPLMAVLLSLVARVPMLTITNTVVGGGLSVLAGTAITTIIASLFGELIRRTGIAESIIRTAAELGGDNTYLVTIFCLLAVGFCYIGLNGAGARIMLGLIIFPIMLSVGVPKTVAAHTLISGSFLGVFLNAARWKFIQSLVDADLAFIQRVALMLLGPGIVFSVIMIIVGIKLKGKVYSWAAESGEAPKKPKVPWYTMISPVVPLILILISTFITKNPVDVNTCFIISMLYVVLTTGGKNQFKGGQDLFTRSLHDALSNSAIQVGLFFGIGMLLNAAKLPELLDPITGLINVIVPTSAVGVVLLFGLLGPFLTMYRGPLNPMGLGAAIAGILATSSIPLGVLVAMFWLYDYFVGVNDPTASQVVWSTGYLELPLKKYVLGVLPYNAAFVFVGMIIAVIRYMLV